MNANWRGAGSKFRAPYWVLRQNNNYFNAELLDAELLDAEQLDAELLDAELLDTKNLT